MVIKYEIANDLMSRIYDIAKTLGMEHIKLSCIYAIRSRGSGSRGTLARCHALGKIWQKAMGINAVYIIEVIEEKFERLPKEEQDKVLIHELMHIPLSFGGGFKHHDFVTSRNVDKIYRRYIELKKNNLRSEFSHIKKEIQTYEQKKGWNQF